MWRVEEIAEVISNIIQKEGKEILCERKKIVAFCGDLLVAYREEYRILQMLFREGLGECILDYPANSMMDLNNNILKIRKFTETLGCSSEITDSIVAIFRIVLYPEYEKKILELNKKIEQLKSLLKQGDVCEQISPYLCELMTDYTDFWKEDSIQLRVDDFIARYIMNIEQKQISIQISMRYVSDENACIQLDCHYFENENELAVCSNIKNASKVYSIIRNNIRGNQLIKTYKQLVKNKKYCLELQKKKEQETIKKLKAMRDFCAAHFSDSQRSKYALIDFTPPNKVALNDFSFPTIKQIVEATKEEYIYWQLVNVRRGRSSMGMEEQIHLYRTLYDEIFLDVSITVSIDKYGERKERTTISLSHMYSQDVNKTFFTKNFLSIVRKSWQILQEKIVLEEKKIEAEKNSIWFLEDDQYDTLRLKQLKEEKRIHFGSQELGQSLPGENGYSLYDFYYEKPSSYNTIKNYHFINKEVDQALRQQKTKLPIVEFKLKYKLLLKEDEYIEATITGLLDWYKISVNSYGRDAGDYYVAEYVGRIVFREKIKQISRNLLMVIEEYIKRNI